MTSLRGKFHPVGTCWKTTEDKIVLKKVCFKSNFRPTYVFQKLKTRVEQSNSLQHIAFVWSHVATRSNNVRSKRWHRLMNWWVNPLIWYEYEYDFHENEHADKPHFLRASFHYWGKNQLQNGIICLLLLIMAKVSFNWRFLFPCRYYLKTSREIKRMEAISQSPVLAHLADTLEGIIIIRTYHMEDKFMQAFNE